MLTKTGPLQPRGVLTSASDHHPPPWRPRADPDPLPQGAQRCLLLQGGAFCHQSPWYLLAPLNSPPGLAFEALSKPLAFQHLTLSPIGQAHLWQVLFTTHTHTYTDSSTSFSVRFPLLPTKPVPCLLEASPTCLHPQHGWPLPHHCPRHPLPGPPLPRPVLLLQLLGLWPAALSLW